VRLARDARELEPRGAAQSSAGVDLALFDSHLYCEFAATGRQKLKTHKELLGRGTSELQGANARILTGSNGHG